MRALKVQVVDFPTPSSLTHYWSWGSVVGLYIVLQVATGLLLATVYLASTHGAFLSIQRLLTEAGVGYLVYTAHAAGAGLVFAGVYVHMSKWIAIRTTAVYAALSGWLLLVLLIVGAFLGYVLLWQQMSYWAATVITSLVSVAPWGGELLSALWGSFTIDGDTLMRFFAFHYLITLVVAALSAVHLVLLHVLGSTPGGEARVNLDGLGFARYYLVKDVLALTLFTLLGWGVLLVVPTLFADVELYISVNTMATPAHIVPEWYLLSYYAMLRGVPSKLMGLATVALGLLLVGLAMHGSEPSAA